MKKNQAYIGNKCNNWINNEELSDVGDLYMVRSTVRSTYEGTTLTPLPLSQRLPDRGQIPSDDKHRLNVKWPDVPLHH